MHDTVNKKLNVNCYAEAAKEIYILYIKKKQRK